MKTRFNSVMLIATSAILLTTGAWGCSPGTVVATDDQTTDTAPFDIPREIPGEDITSDLTEDLPSGCPEEFQPCTFCETDEECEDLFDDLDGCESTLCHPEYGVCAVRPLEEGASCADDTLCNGDEICLPEGEDEAIVCTAGTTLICDDGNPCNGDEGCDPVAGCQSGTPLVCEDDDVCNGVATCIDGEGCTDGEPLVCDDSDPCTGEESCDPTEGCQEGEPLVCEDEDICNGISTCTTGEGCVDGEPLVCDDGNPCNGQEECDPVDGCKEVEPLQCDDNNACNGEETCDPELGCVLGKAPKCNDNNLCNGTETCDPAQGCVSSNVPDCDDNNPCTDDTCFPVSGCAHFPNGNPGCCQVDDDCDDSNPCTADACDDGTKACLHTAQDGDCDDMNPCTIGDTCLDSECQPGQALPNCSIVCYLSGDKGSVVECDTSLARRTEDGNPATTLSFALTFKPADLVAVVDQVCPQPGECSSISITSGGGSLFESGHAVYFAPDSPALWNDQVEVSLLNAIDPSVPISQAWFNEDEKLVGDGHLLGFHFELTETIEAGAAVPVILHSIAATGASGDPLAIATVESLVITSDDACGNSLMHCFDARQCTANTCLAAETKCVFEVQYGPCDDGNACTQKDFCDDFGDCVPLLASPEGTECNGLNLCTEVGLCNGTGTCILDEQLAVNCPPAPSSCAAYKCLPGTGTCNLAPYTSGTSCDDNIPCTLNDECNGIGDCAGTLVDCDDNVVCTMDSCVQDSGQCINTPDVALCDDGNPCTEDSCDPQSGCVQIPLDAVVCNDQNPCTSSDTCKQGVCEGTWDAVCGCDKTSDCNGLEDGDLCTGTYICVDSTCVVAPNSVVICPEYADDCQVWECSPDSGDCIVVDAPEGTDCDSGGCLLDPKCDNQGTCSGTLVDCDDGDTCTADLCVPDQGCTYEAIPDCESKYCICKISGEAGSQTTCPLLLVRDTFETKAPVGADFKLQWDQDSLELVSFLDEVCMGPICLPKTIPTCQPGGTGCVWGSLYPTGHNIVAVPKQLADWDDHGTLLFFHPSDPFAPITDAYLVDDSLEGEPLYLNSSFTLAQDIPAEDPVCIWMSAPHFSLANGLSLDVKVMTIDDDRAVVVY
jgi:hypothetical protein